VPVLQTGNAVQIRYVPNFIINLRAIRLLV